MRRASTILVTLAITWCTTPQLHAQNAARTSFQVSALYNTLGGDDYTNINAGVGAEAQLRRAVGAWSVGGGGQYTRHDIAADAGVDGTVTLAGVFLEPRYVIPTSSSAAAPYLSARLAFLQQKYDTDLFSGSATGFQANLGGGVLVGLSQRVNLDLGVTFGVVNFGEFKVDDPNLEVESGSGSGTNAVFRLGLSIGVGK